MSDGCINCDDWEGNPELAVCGECWPEKIERLREGREYDREQRLLLGAEIELQRKRIEEMEEASVKEVLEFGVEQMSRGHDKYYIFDNEMINNAWKCTIPRGLSAADQFFADGAGEALAELGIVRCEGCYSCMEKDSAAARMRLDCGGHGWVVRDE